jgi:hypothetical protein
MNRIPPPDPILIPSRQDLWLIAFARGLSQTSPAAAGRKADQALAIHDAKWSAHGVVSPVEARDVTGPSETRRGSITSIEEAEEAAKRIPPKFYTRTPHELRYRGLG